MTPEDEALFKAIVIGDRHAAEAALKAGADANARDDLDRTPLHYAAYNNLVQIAQLLIDNNADVNATTSGMTPRDYATFYGRDEVAELLITAARKQKEHAAGVAKPNASHAGDAKARKNGKREIE